ncbi:hypothetical protein BC829DRAFT_393236, partial [Chytridium lagenaria]
GMTVLTNSESPIVVRRLLFLSMASDPIRVGDICVVIEKHDGDQFILTKGDNNAVDDRGLYNPHQMWIKQKDVVGRVKGFLPYVGMITIILNDYPN